MVQTLAETRRDVRSHVDESVEAFWEDSELDRWIWEAARDIARQGEVLQAVRSIDTTAGRVNYDLPEDLLRIHRVEHRRSSGYIQPLEPRQIGELDDVWWTNRESGGLPLFYSVYGTPGIEGSQLYVFPVPSDTVKDGLRIFYLRLPRKPLQDKDPVEVPAGWEDLISLYVEVNALRKAGSPRWREAQEMYDAKLESMIRMTRSFTDQQSSFITGREAYPFWLPPFDY